MMEKEAVDPYFDTTMTMLSNGNIFISSGSRVNDLIADATKKYARAHNQQVPLSVADLSPYFTEPIEPALLQKLEEISRRGGK